jgi:hypothetical protein
MRTTITLDDDVTALIEHERERTGESFKQVVNRLLRRGATAEPPRERPPLPVFPGRPLIDITDVSAVLAMLDEERIDRYRSRT